VLADGRVTTIEREVKKREPAAWWKWKWN